MARQATVTVVASIPPIVRTIIEREAGRLREELFAAELRVDEHRRKLEDELMHIAALKIELDKLAAVHRSDLTSSTTDTEGN